MEKHPASRARLIAGSAATAGAVALVVGFAVTQPPSRTPVSSAGDVTDADISPSTSPSTPPTSAPSTRNGRSNRRSFGGGAQTPSTTTPSRQQQVPQFDQQPQQQPVPQQQAPRARSRAS